MKLSILLLPIGLLIIGSGYLFSVTNSQPQDQSGIGGITVSVLTPNYSASGYSFNLIEIMGVFVTVAEFIHFIYRGVKGAATIVGGR